MIYSQLFRRLASLALALLFHAGGLLQAQDPPKAPQSQIFALTPTVGPFTEPAIAVNPMNPQQVVGVFQDNVHASYSTDAGHSWQPAENVEPKNYRVSGDVSVAFDNQGHAFVCYIAFDKLGSFNYWARGATRNGIFVRRSLDAGKRGKRSYPRSGAVKFPGFHLKTSRTLSPTTARVDTRAISIGWTRWRLTDSQMVISRSTDDGKTWSQPREIDAHPGLPRDDNGAVEGFDGVVDPDGKLYAIWSQDNDIMLTVSKDGGRRFPAPIIHTAPVMFAIQTLEGDGFPQLRLIEEQASVCHVERLSQWRSDVFQRRLTTAAGAGALRV
jgi:hypothetical protein